MRVMPDELYLPLIAAAVLLWYLVSALRQQRIGRSTGPTLVWREATAAGWSEWRDLVGVAPSTDYAGVVAAVRAQAGPHATAVQFASIVHPVDAPDYTVRVLFVSAVWEAAPDRASAPTR
jgi:hypothetical protein